VTDVFIAAVLSLAALLLFVFPLHEAAHGLAALLLGDPTAKEAGRLTLNPAAHVNATGYAAMSASTLLAAGGQGGPLEFGWAKPTPVDRRRLRGGPAGEILVALAGPAIHLAVAAISAVAAHLIAPTAETGLPGYLYGYFAAVNLYLLALNVLPLYPLDGHRVLLAIAGTALTEGTQRSLERLGPWLIAAVVLIPMPFLPRNQPLITILIDWIVNPLLFIMLAPR
jgi:Zn-dependent protease